MFHDQKENIEDQQDHDICYSEIPRTSLLIAAGSPVKDITNDNTEDAPMISITIVVGTAASTQQLFEFTNLIVLNKHGEDKGVCNRNTGCLCRCKFSR